MPPVYAEPERDAWMAAHPPGWLEYLEAFGPSGKYGRWIRARQVAVRVGDTIFLHGGLDPERAPKKPDAASEQARKELARWDAMRAWMIDKNVAAASFNYVELVDAGRAELARVAAEARGAEVNPSTGVPAAVSRHPVADLLAVEQWSIIDERGPLWFRRIRHVDERRRQDGARSPSSTAMARYASSWVTPPYGRRGRWHGSTTGCS